MNNQKQKSKKGGAVKRKKEIMKQAQEHKISKVMQHNHLQSVKETNLYHLIIKMINLINNSKQMHAIVNVELHSKN